MSKLNVEVCPETGICSIIKADGNKVDLMPDEAKAVVDLAGDSEAIRKTLADIDPDFADSLDASQLSQISKELH